MGTRTPQRLLPTPRGLRTRGTRTPQRSSRAHPAWLAYVGLELLDFVKILEAEELHAFDRYGFLSCKFCHSLSFWLGCG